MRYAKALLDIMAVALALLLLCPLLLVVAALTRPEAAGAQSGDENAGAAPALAEPRRRRP
ncbi:hypothetical protein [Marinimicrococcus flavescens]|uniref:Uncharacterized protein n=1 Tax=Marinimicrococcus flavescens TaxID=3031815 RepID=A0AAP4D5M1_9PROT|nr:hypothetical protein [Marinimicrococcus flavescens]